VNPEDYANVYGTLSVWVPILLAFAFGIVLWIRKR
jgi:hypothetical protein